MTDLLEHAFSYWRSGGWLLLPIALVSIGICLTFLRTRAVLVRVARDGDRIVNDLECGVLGHSLSTLQDRLDGLPGGIATMMSLVLRDVAHGARFQDAFLTYEEQCRRLLQRDFVLLSAFTAVAPLLGLFGTVMGMITTFSGVAGSSQDVGNSVAGGISQALITTQFGLLVALPGVFGLTRLQRMLRYVEVTMATCKALTMDVLEVSQVKDVDTMHNSNSRRANHEAC